MQRIRSPKLYRFLKEQGALQNPREIKRLKREYRRIYKRNWSKNHRKNEIRFTLTKGEYGVIKGYCQKESLKPTQLAKELLIAHSKGIAFVPNREQLVCIAKDLGLAINRINSKGGDSLALQKLLSAESKLLTYLNP